MTKVAELGSFALFFCISLLYLSLFLSPLSRARERVKKEMRGGAGNGDVV